MFWIPVVFVCTVNSDCGFIYDQPQQSKNKCVAALQKLEKRLPQENFPIFKAACLEVEISGGRI